jgi:DNA damage-inducible protein 1
MELGFDRDTVIQALSLFNGNEEQAASYLSGGF